VGAPGGTSSALISVGALVSPALAAAGHSLRALGALGEVGQQYTWSSRGPTAVRGWGGCGRIGGWMGWVGYLGWVGWRDCGLGA